MILVPRALGPLCFSQFLFQNTNTFPRSLIMSSSSLVVNKEYFSGEKHQQRNWSNLVQSQVSHHSLMYSKQHQLPHQHISKLHKIIIAKGLMPDNIMPFFTHFLSYLAHAGIQYCLTVPYLVLLFFLPYSLLSHVHIVCLKKNMFPPSCVLGFF